MSPFVGGSAPAMASQIVDGYTLLTAVQLKRLTPGEMEKLSFVLGKALRDLRGEVVPLDDIPLIQARNRKLARINGALQQIQATRARRGPRS